MTKIKKGLFLLFLAALMPLQQEEIKQKKIECFKPHKYLAHKRSGKRKK